MDTSILVWCYLTCFNTGPKKKWRSKASRVLQTGLWYFQASARLKGTQTWKFTLSCYIYLWFVTLTFGEHLQAFLYFFSGEDSRRMRFISCYCKNNVLEQLCLLSLVLLWQLIKCSVGVCVPERHLVKKQGKQLWMSPGAAKVKTILNCCFWTNSLASCTGGFTWTSTSGFGVVRVRRGS